MIDETATTPENPRREPPAETPLAPSDASPGADAALSAPVGGDSNEPTSDMPNEIQPVAETPAESSSASASIATTPEPELSPTAPSELRAMDRSFVSEPETSSTDTALQPPGPTESLKEPAADVKPDSDNVSAENPTGLITPSATVEPASASDEPSAPPAATAAQSDQQLDSDAGPAPAEEAEIVEEPTGSVSSEEVADAASAPVGETFAETAESVADQEVAAELAEPSTAAAKSAEPEEPTASAGVASPKTESPSKPKRTRKKAAATDTAAAAVAVAESASGSDVAPTEEPPAPENKKKWYAIKVQSGREDTIKAAILRKVAIEGLEQYVGQIVIPVEEVVEKKTVRIKDKKTGEYTTQERKVTKKKKKFHGYIFAELEFNDRILYLFRETSGVGDFLNMRGKPPVPEPMPEHEVQSMLTGITVKDPLKRAKFKLDFEKGDRVRIREGSFINNEGEVKEISEVKDPTDTPKVKVELTFWGRPLEVELDASQVEKI